MIDGQGQRGSWRLGTTMLCADHIRTGVCGTLHPQLTKVNHYPLEIPERVAQIDIDIRIDGALIIVGRRNRNNELEAFHPSLPIAPELEPVCDILRDLEAGKTVQEQSVDCSFRRSLNRPPSEFAEPLQYARQFLRAHGIGAV